MQQNIPNNKIFSAMAIFKAPIWLNMREIYAQNTNSAQKK
ncbi:uncharacterized protein METZ01_LOCUS429305 [marine metagenome]|uniref:Uncharacterized protein n=1 Tax=marine metagenome TaxID=408172 RepID=A0A382Y128_9ZZZZ